MICCACLLQCSSPTHSPLCSIHQGTGRPQNTLDTMIQKLCGYQQLSNNCKLDGCGTWCKPVVQSDAAFCGLLCVGMNKAISRAFPCTNCRSIFYFSSTLHGLRAGIQVSFHFTSLHFASLRFTSLHCTSLHIFSLQYIGVIL